MSEQTIFQNSVEKTKFDTGTSSKEDSFGSEDEISNNSISILEKRAGKADVEEKRIVKHWYDGFVRLFLWYPS